MTDYIDYLIPTHFITAIVYGDYSALSDDQVQDLAYFTDQLPAGSWIFPSNLDHQITFQHSNDVDSTACECVTAKLSLD